MIGEKGYAPALRVRSKQLPGSPTNAQHPVSDRRPTGSVGWERPLSRQFGTIQLARHESGGVRRHGVPLPGESQYSILEMNIADLQNPTMSRSPTTRPATAHQVSVIVIQRVDAIATTQMHMTSRIRRPHVITLATPRLPVIRAVNADLAGRAQRQSQPLAR